MPSTKDSNSKYNYTRSFSNNEMSMSARVYHPATNLMPLTQTPQSPNGMGPNFSRSNSAGGYTRQNSQSRS